MRMKQMTIVLLGVVGAVAAGLSLGFTGGGGAGARDGSGRVSLVSPHGSSGTALLITDPQNDFLKPGGAAWELVKDNLGEHGVIEHIEQLLRAAKQSGTPVFVSPHMYHAHDDGWTHRGGLQGTLNQIRMFHVSDAVYREGLRGSGADFLERYKPYILDGKTVITSPHKVYGPESNDLVLQLRKRGVRRVIVGGMAANLCTDSHMRELIEQGFEVIMVKDAVGAPGDEAYRAAMVNYGLIANGVVTTEEAVRSMSGG